MNTWRIQTNLAGGWVIRKAGATRARKKFPGLRAARAFGLKLAKADKGRLVVHTREGLVSEDYDFSK